MYQTWANYMQQYSIRLMWIALMSIHVFMIVYAQYPPASACRLAWRMATHPGIVAEKVQRPPVAQVENATSYDAGQKALLPCVRVPLKGVRYC